MLIIQPDHCIVLSMSVKFSEELISILYILWVLLKLSLQTMQLLYVVERHLIFGIFHFYRGRCRTEHSPQIMSVEVSS